MGFRFRRSIRLAKGFRINLSKSGFSLSAGVPGATLNFGKRGIKGTVGLPGTGLSYSQMLTTRNGLGSSRATLAERIEAYRSSSPDGAAFVSGIERLVQSSYRDIKNYGNEHGWPLVLSVFATPAGADTDRWHLLVSNPDEPVDPPNANSFLLADYEADARKGTQSIILGLIEGLKHVDTTLTSATTASQPAASPAANDTTSLAVGIGCIGAIAVLILIGILAAILNK